MRRLPEKAKGLSLHRFEQFLVGQGSEIGRA
jgi:hypothetical protein